MLANLNAADYLGALIGGLAWPFRGAAAVRRMIRGAAVTGMINLAAAAIVAVFLLRTIISRRQLASALAVLTAAGLGLTALIVASDGIQSTTVNGCTPIRSSPTSSPPIRRSW